MPPKTQKSKPVGNHTVGVKVSPNGVLPDYEPTSVLKVTEKVSKCALLIQERCNACHGRTVRDVLGSMNNDGVTYRLADLKYDMRQGRLEPLPPGTSAGPDPTIKLRDDAPCAGQPLPAASMQEFLTFLQGQLWFEAKYHTGEDIKLVDKLAQEMVPYIESFIKPNLGATERWVPYHTILGVHELFLVEAIHSRKDWSDKQRFLAIFVFRAHCKRDLFTQAQLPLMLQKTFWEDPVKAFEPGGPMEKAILSYRKKTGNPLLTSCFRIIPERLLKDDTENLVRSITNRTQRLLQVAEMSYPVMKEKKMPSAEKFEKISGFLQNTHGLGDTWAKMLTVCLDLGYPSVELLKSQCDVGIGAAVPMKSLLPKGDVEDKRTALQSLLKMVNSAKGASATHFWATLRDAENAIRTHYKKYPLVCAQADTKMGNMTASTLQVQLCEYRQFRHSLARHKYGLPDDESMRADPEKDNVLHAEDFVEIDKKGKCARFDFPSGATKIPFEVSLRLLGNKERVGLRVATMCFKKMQAGISKQDVEKFRDELLSTFRGGEDVSDDSPAWEDCRTNFWGAAPSINFVHVGKQGRIPFQTTMLAAEGSLLDAERICRLCWAKFKTGASKDSVLKYRSQLYASLTGQKRPSTASNDQSGARKRFKAGTLQRH